MPTIKGPKKEPRALKMLINPVAAAADCPKIKLGKIQKVTPQDIDMPPVRHRNRNTIGKGKPGRALIMKNIPAITKGISVCNLRFPVRSEDFAKNVRETIAQAKGKAESTVEENIDSPD